ncbi:MAG: hypothetical protein ACXQS8_08175, partial [Candidatus Helarchaeales archaeon]
NYGVDVVFQGHDHHYERMLVNGIYYFVTGGGGGPLDFYMPWEIQRTWSTYKLLFHHYMTADVNGNVLTLRAVRVDGFVMDTIQIVKG